MVNLFRDKRMKEIARAIHIRYLETPVGEMVLGSIDGQLCLCDWRYRSQREQVDQRLKRYFQAEFLEKPTTVTDLAASQISDYFNQRVRKFSVPLVFAGTEFQITVWKEIMKIPYGTTVSYQDLAVRTGRPDAVRAVANINGQNAIALLVPCHRVVGGKGTMTGYSGGISAKKYLLRLEGWAADSEPTLFAL